jgi:ABC-2 type transport system permease protein
MTALAPSPGPAGLTPDGSAVAARILGNEAGKQARLLWRRRGLVIAGIVANGASYLLFRLLYTIGPGVLVPLILTILDGLAYAVMMTALVLRVASIGAIVHVFNMAIMFFGGMAIPVSAFPHGVEVFARFLPTTLGVEAVSTALAGRGLSAAWADRTLPWLTVHTVVLGALSWVTYTRTLRRARREGGLSPR